MGSEMCIRDRLFPVMQNPNFDLDANLKSKGKPSRRAPAGMARSCYGLLLIAAMGLPNMAIAKAPQPALQLLVAGTAFLQVAHAVRAKQAIGVLRRGGSTQTVELLIASSGPCLVS